MLWRNAAASEWRNWNETLASLFFFWRLQNLGWYCTIYLDWLAVPTLRKAFYDVYVPTQSVAAPSNVFTLVCSSVFSPMCATQFVFSQWVPQGVPMHYSVWHRVCLQPILARRPPPPAPPQPSTTPPFQKMQILPNLAKVGKNTDMTDLMLYVFKYFIQTILSIWFALALFLFPKKWMLTYFTLITNDETFCSPCQRNCPAREGVFQEPSTGKLYTCGKILALSKTIKFSNLLSVVFQQQSGWKRFFLYHCFLQCHSQCLVR